MAFERPIKQDPPAAPSIDKVEMRARKLVLVIGHGTLPRCQIMGDLGFGQCGRRNFYRNYLYPAYEKGYIKLFKPDSPTSPEQAYLLTPKGLDLLATLTAEEAI